ncbi:MAG: hypothetical protein IJT97_03030 [Bacteroidaceae bacterium]|nr:hypothetical protein [Bacteroidaceae bacterium]
MSDGNFNRQLLPKTELSSGIRAGKAQMRQKAEQAFDAVLSTYFADESQSRQNEIKAYFMDMLRN